MSKISRATQLIFGASAGANTMSRFGDLFASYPSVPTRYSGATITPALIQALSNYLSAWEGAAIGGNSPAIEDMNGLFFLVTYQLAYLLQEGIPEWDSGTTYFKGSTVMDTGGLGKRYISLTDNNLNNALSSTANWRLDAGLAGNLVTIDPSVSSPYTLGATDNGSIFLVRSNNAAMTFNLPSPASMPLGWSISVQDRDGNFGTNNCTFHRNASESIQGVAADYIAAAAFGGWTILTDNTNWYFKR